MTGVRRLILPLLFVLSTAGAGEVNPNTKFADLLIESGMVFEQPQGFSDIKHDESLTFTSERHLVSDDGLLEIRYQVRPLGRIKVDYEDPHNSAPHPNDLFEMLFRSIAQSLADGGVFNSRSYPVEQANALFDAGWAAFAIFDLNASVSDEYGHAMLLAIHRNDAADAYTLFLTNDLVASKERIQAVMTALKFDPDADLAGVIPANPHMMPPKQAERHSGE